MGYRVLAIPLNDISIKTVLYEILHFHQACYACYFTSIPIFFWGSRISRGPTLTENEDPKMGYGVLASLLNDIPIATVNDVFFTFSPGYM